MHVQSCSFANLNLLFFLHDPEIWLPWQCGKKVVSDSTGLVDFAIGLVNSAFNLPDGQVGYFEEFNLQKNCEINSAHQKIGGTS